MLSKRIIAVARGRGFVAGHNARGAVSMSRGWCVAIRKWLRDVAEWFMVRGREVASSYTRRAKFHSTSLIQGAARK